MGLPVPAVWGVQRIDARWGIVFDRVKHASFAEQMRGDPTAMPHYLETLAALQARIHAQPASQFSSLKLRLAANMALTNVLDEPRKRVLGNEALRLDLPAFARRAMHASHGQTRCPSERRSAAHPRRQEPGAPLLRLPRGLPLRGMPPALPLATGRASRRGDPIRTPRPRFQRPAIARRFCSSSITCVYAELRILPSDITMTRSAAAAKSRSWVTTITARP